MDDRSSKKLCLVCGEEASACSACRMFFIKTINNKTEYKCPARNDCDISMEKRTSCRACRFNKCLGVGMITESVSLPKVALDDNCLLEAQKNAEPKALFVTTGEGDIQLTVNEVLNKLSDLFGLELRSTVEWAKLIPGFPQLCLNDQILLLKTCWAEILSLDLVYRSLPLSEQLKFSNNFVLRKRQGKALNAEELFSQYLQVVQRLDILKISSVEYFILKALVLFNSDVQLEGGAAVMNMRVSLLACLHDSVNAYHLNPSQHVSNLLLCLPLLRQVDASVRRFWTNVRREGNVAMDKLLVQMLET